MQNRNKKRTDSDVRASEPAGGKVNTQDGAISLSVFDYTACNPSRQHPAAGARRIRRELEALAFNGGRR